MILTESDARQVLEVIRQHLEEIGAREVLDGIEESRRLGAEESLQDQAAKELKLVGAMRRRPLNPVEELNIVLEHLQERLVVVPRLAASIQERLHASEVEWRVDTEFVSTNRVPQVRIASLLPEGHGEVNQRIGDIVKRAEIPAGSRVG